MLAKQPMARRIVIAFTLMTLVVSGAFALGIVGVVHFIEEQLVKTYNECEREAEKYFEERVRERFASVFADANPVDLRGLLPKKPPVEWAELPVEVQRELQNIHDTAQEEGITERTLKKRVRQYLIDQYIIED